MLKELGIPARFLPEPKETPFDRLRMGVENYVHDSEINLNEPTIEGESKKIYRHGKLALVELKPTMYSFTANRYGIVEGTDTLRMGFWDFFGSRLNNTAMENAISRAEPQSIVCNTQLPLISSYLGSVKLGGKDYAIVKFEDYLPPVEVVWKRYLVGTMKHALKGVDAKKRMNSDAPLEYEERFPSEIVRFDWRNPLPDKDECIPEDFAGLYIKTGPAKSLAHLVSSMIDQMLSKAGYELVDICYFMDSNGSIVHSEITPDGMRIRNKGDSYDKDLWRQGKDRETIINTWKKLYADLTLLNPEEGD